MKKIILSIVAVAALVALPMGVKAQTTVVGTTTVTSADVNVGAHIIQPLSITTDGTKLNFGTIAASASGGTVVLDPATAAATPTGVTLVTAGTYYDQPTVPKFTVNGEGNYGYTITSIPSTLTLKGQASSSNVMTVSAFTTSLGSGTAATAGTLASGKQSFTVGATLTVGTAQVSDNYSATFPITVAYNWIDKHLSNLRLK
jgi:hypothetical protein